MRIQSGVMIMKNGKAWGVEYEDGKCIRYGWIDPEDAEIHDPGHCRKPTDATYKGSPYVRELETAKLVRVTRITALTFEEEKT